MTQKFDLLLELEKLYGCQQCRSAGWEVAIIDSRPLAVPVPYEDVRQRVRLMLQNLPDWLQRMEGRAFLTRHSHGLVDAFQRTFTEPVPSKRETVCRCRNRHVPRAGAFVAQTTAQVGDDTRSIYSIATGAKPAGRIPGEVADH